MNEYEISYAMVDGEVFEWIYGSKTRKEIADLVYNQLEQTCFHLGQIPITILASANVRSVDVSEKIEQ